MHTHVTIKIAEGANFKNVGNCASSCKQIALAICEFYDNESSKAVIYLLEY